MDQRMKHVLFGNVELNTHQPKTGVPNNND